MGKRLVLNAVGRMVPTLINGEPAVPFLGVGNYSPRGRVAGPPLVSCADYPADGDKVVPTLDEALRQCGLRDGMTLSTHHHFRDGDLVAEQVFDAAARLGVRGLRWFPSAAFPCHRSLIRHLQSGVLDHIEGSMNGPLGDYCSRGHMRGVAVLRSHGGRWQALQDGEVRIDIAIIAAPSADCFGNCNGTTGPSACGPLGYAEADARFADRVIVVTDNLVPFPCFPWHIQGQRVDCVVVVDRVGVPDKIVSGTTKVTSNPERLRIAELIARFADAAGIVRPGFSFQTGAGGISLAFTRYLADVMRQRSVRASFYLGGSNQLPVRMLADGLVEHIIDIQAFDLEAVQSARTDARHIACGPYTTYNYHGKGNLNSLTDIVVLGATEVDTSYNANVITHSDGLLQHGIGGWQNCLHARCTVLAMPSQRRGQPVIVDAARTIVGPGELVDVVATEHGLCINPRRQDLLDAVQGAGLPLLSIEELRTRVVAECGPPAPEPRLGGRVVAAVKWVDGTVIDCVYQVLD